MTKDDLKDQIAVLRVQSPRLNELTDHVMTVIKEVERTLRDDLAISVTARVELQRTPASKYAAVKVTYLEYGRLNGRWRIYLADCPDYASPIIDPVCTPIENCTREGKFKAAFALTDLLAALIAETERLTETGEESFRELERMGFRPAASQDGPAAPEETR